MADIISNLDLHWNFDDGSGSSAADASGNGLTGTLNNSPTWTLGPIGGAVVFNGSNSNVSRAAYTMPTTGTFAAWLRPTRAWNSGISETPWRFGAGNVFDFTKFADNKLYAGFLNGGTDYRANVTALSNWLPYAWQHFAVTWTSGGATTLYRNGAAIGSTADTNSTLVAGTLRVGSSDTQTLGFSGMIDDVRIYSRALSADDVAALYAYSGGRYLDSGGAWSGSGGGTNFRFGFRF